MEISSISNYATYISDEKNEPEEPEKSEELQRRIEQLLRRLPDDQSWQILDIVPPDQPLPPHYRDNIKQRN